MPTYSCKCMIRLSGKPVNPYIATENPEYGLTKAHCNIEINNDIHSLHQHVHVSKHYCIVKNHRIKHGFTAIGVYSGATKWTTSVDIHSPGGAHDAYVSLI